MARVFFLASSCRCPRRLRGRKFGVHLCFAFFGSVCSGAGNVPLCELSSFRSMLLRRLHPKLGLPVFILQETHSLSNAFPLVVQSSWGCVRNIIRQSQRVRRSSADPIVTAKPQFWARLVFASTGDVFSLRCTAHHSHWSSISENVWIRISLSLSRHCHPLR